MRQLADKVGRDYGAGHHSIALGNGDCPAQLGNLFQGGRVLDARQEYLRPGGGPDRLRTVGAPPFAELPDAVAYRAQ